LATYSADISVKVVGLTQLRNLENRLTQLQERFTKINAAATRITAPFQAHIQALQTMNTLLQQNGRLLNAQASAVAKATGRQSGGRGPAKTDPRIEKERSDELQRQLGLLKERARVLQGNTTIMAKLLRAEVEITAATGGNVRLGKELMKNARSLLVEEEKLARVKKAAADKAVADAEREEKARVSAINKVRAAEERLQAKLDRSKAKADARAKAEELANRNAAARTLGNVAGRVGGAIDRSFGGAFSGVGRAAEGAVIRGGAVAGGLAAAGGLNVLNNIADKVPGISAASGAVADLVATLANLPGGLGAAAVAAAAFAPWLPKMAQGAYAAGDALGKLESSRALKNFANKGGASFFDSATNALGGMSAEIKSATGGPAMDLSRLSSNGAAFMPKWANLLLQTKFLPQYLEASAKALKLMGDQFDRIDRSAKAGVLGNKTQLRGRLQEFLENKNSAQIARERSAAQLALEARQVGGNYSLSQVPARGQLYPAGNTMTAQPGYRAMLNARAATGQAADGARAASTAQTLLGFEARMLRTSENLLSVKQRISAEDSKSVSIARERNRILMEQYKAEQRAASGTLDPGSLRADRRRRVAAGRAKQDKAQALPESLALGVGFPLLFGAGAGSVGGSLAGSFVGKGFGGQILGGAIGAKLDEFVAAVNEFGSSLLDITSIFDTLKEKSLISSRALEKQIERTNDAGFAATANAAAQKDLADSLGAGNVADLVAVGVASDNLTRAFALLGAQMQSLAAKPIAAIQNRFADVVGVQTELNRANTVSGELRRTGKTAAADKLDAAIMTNSLDPRNTLGLDPGAIRNSLKKAIAEASKSLPPVEIKIDAKQAREELITSLEKGLQAIDLARSITNQIRGRAREQEDLDQQRAEMVLQNERAIADLRQSIEDKIADARLSNLQRENELFRVQGEIRAKALELSTRNLGTGATDSRVNEAGSAIADYLQKELEIANDAAAIKRDAALEVQRLDIETERFKLQVATQLIRMEQDSAKRVSDINKGVRRSNQDQDNRKFDLEKRIAKLRLDSIAAEAALGVQQAGNAGLTETVKALQIVQGYAQQYSAYIDNLKPPAALKEIGGVGVGGATTGGLEAVNARAKELVNSMATARQDLLKLAQDGNLETLKERLKQIFADPLDKAMASAKALFTVLNQGFGVVTNEAASDAAGLATLNKDLDDLNKKIQASTQITAANKAVFEAWIKLLKAAIPENTKQVEGIEAINDRLKSLNEKYLELQDALEALETPYGELTEVQKAINDLTRRGIDLNSAEAAAMLGKAKAVDVLAEQLEKMQQLRADAESISGITINGIQEALVASVTGGDIRAAFSTMFEQLGNQFLTMGLRPVQEWLAQEIAKLLGLTLADAAQSAAVTANTGAVTAAATAITTTVIPVVTANTTAMTALTAAVTANTAAQSAGATASAASGFNWGSLISAGLGSITGGGFGGGGINWGQTPSIGGVPDLPGLGGLGALGRASGGSATSGQPYVVGERGPELFVPGQSGGITNHQNLRSLMASGQAGGGADGQGGTTMNLKFETTQFMDREWVDRQQLEAAMATSAKQGAAQGERRALDRMRNSPRTRRSIGI